MALTVDVLKLLTDNFAYGLRQGDAVTIIDPGEATPIVKYLETQKLRLELILCTHHHFDHIGGASELAKKYGCPIWASKWDRERIPGSSRWLDDDERVQVAGEEMQVLFVPGHTDGQISFYFRDSSALFTGDTLFSLGCGRLFEGTPSEMLASLQKLAALPNETKIYFGHEYTIRNGEFAKTLASGNNLLAYLEEVEQRLDRGEPSTPALLGREKRLNPFLNTTDLKEWTRRRELRNSF